MKGHRLFAAIYNPLMASTEKAGLAEMRADLLMGARGKVLELGAGTGLNLEHYTDAVTELVLTEPDPHMAKRLRKRVAELGLPFPAEVVVASAEDLPFPDDSFDALVSTLVLCTVLDPQQATREAARVLREGGELLVLEHVRGEPASARSRWQDRLERPWGWFTGGCHPNRDTAATLSVAFDVSGLDPDKFPKAPPVVEPLVKGRATAR